MRNEKQTGRGFQGKGYYIALILCAVAIGISGFLYYRNANEEEPQQLSHYGATVPGKQGEDVAAMNTDPTKPPKPTNPPQQTVPPTQGKSLLQTASPLAGETVMAYAMESLSYNPTTRDWRVHQGIDIAADAGTAVGAAADGTVYSVYEDDTLGTTVVIRHQDGYTTCYSSLAEASVQDGDAVTLGQPIGTVGTSALLETAIGEHLHFSVLRNDEPVDPMEFLNMSE